MTTVSVCVCDFGAGNKISRLPVQVGDMTGKTDSLFSDIAKQTGFSDFEIYYCGQKLEKNMMLETFNLSTQSTLFVFRKGPSPRKDPPNSMNVGECVPFIQKAVQNPNYRKTVDYIMTNSGSLRKLLAAVPGLGEDPMILSMLQDPELLQILAHQQNIYKVCRKHPLFEAAAFYVAGMVNEEHARDSTRVRGNVYSLDQMSDEEDEGSQREAVAGASQQQPQQQITASQLAAALAAASASARPSTSTSFTGASAPAARRHGTQPTSTSGSSTSVISNDFFQQAMMTAQSSALEAQLQQLRDMGITDDNAARQALNATGGDLQAALDLIFGDNNM